jgi:hypothetical protein
LSIKIKCILKTAIPYGKYFAMTEETHVEIPYAAADAYRDNRLDDLNFLLDQWVTLSIDQYSGHYGDALFMRHTYNGLMALDKGDVQQAKRELLMAGKSPKAGVISSFGPNMSLAKRLLEAGEQETVLLFLKYCKGFWFFPCRLFFSRKWKGDILAGKIPNFEVHVKSFMERPACADNDCA